MYEYDSILNGKTSRDAYTEKLHQAENERKAHNLTAKHNSIRNLLTVLNIFS